VTQGDNQIAEQDANNDEDQGYIMGNVQESLVIGRTRRNPRYLCLITTNMIMAYALSVIEEVIPSTYRELKSV